MTEVHSDVADTSGELDITTLFKAGVHFGHYTKRWNPRMSPYIFSRRLKMHIIDLNQTLQLLKEAKRFVTDLVARGGEVLFVGAKPQARAIIREQAQICESMYVTQRWLGGTLTNFQTIEARIHKLIHLEDALAKGTVETTTKRETLKVRTEIERLNRNLGGIKEIERLPDALFIIDPHREEIAVKEAHSLSIPIVAVLDTDCDPRFIDYPIPGNDDSVHSIKLISSEIASAVSEGNKIYRERRDRRLAAEEELAAMEEAARAERQQAAAARHERQQEKLDSEQESSITASEIVQSKDDLASDKVTEERKSDDENADKGHIDEKQNPLIETETQDSKGT